MKPLFQRQFLQHHGDFTAQPILHCINNNIDIGIGQICFEISVFDCNCEVKPYYKLLI